MTKRKSALKVGDEVALHWHDICSLDRINNGSDEDIRLGEFVSYGKVSYIGDDKIVLRHEEEIVNDGPQIREPSAYPLGCIFKIRKTTRHEEVTFKKTSR